MAFSRLGEDAAESPALGPVRDPGPAEQAAEPGLGALCPATLRPGGAPGTPGWAFKEEGLRNRNAGLGETEKPELSRCHNRQRGRRSCRAPRIFGRGGAGPRRGWLGFYRAPGSQESDHLRCEVGGFLPRGRQIKRSSPGIAAGVPGGTCNSPESCPNSQACVWLLCCLNLDSSSQGSQEPTDTLISKGSASPSPALLGQGQDLWVPPASWISHQPFAAPQWLPEEKQGLVLRARRRRAVRLQAGFGFHS